MFSRIRQEGFSPTNDLFQTMDFGDELTGLMDTNNKYHQYRHNIFDTSSTTYSDFNAFNSTIPAINSSMRYDPHPSIDQHPPPSSFHSFNSRHTPSPSVGSPGRRPVGSRSRSRSRPPPIASSSSNSSSSNNGNGAIGPARTSRARRNSSISGTSPPPFGHAGHGRPHAIVIPGSGRGAGASNGNWFGQSSPHPLGHHTTSHSLTLPKSPIEFTSSSSSSTTTASNGAQQLGSPLLTTHPLVVGNNNQQQQQRAHAPSLSHSLSHGTLNAGLSSMNSMSSSMGSIGMGGYANMGMGMNSLGSMGSMGSMMGGMGLSLGSLNNLQTPPIPTPSNNNNNNPPPVTSAQSQQQPLAATTDKQSLLANEKRRRRRESHNAVERRRRDNINEKISELATLIPECMLEAGNTNGNGNGNVNGGSSSPTHLSPTSPGGIGLLDAGSDPLLPSSFGLPNTNANTNGSSSPINGNGSVKEENGHGEGEAGGVVKANKGMILRKSVDYIRYLQQLVTAQGARNRELEQELKAYRRSSGSAGGSVDSNSPKLNGAVYNHPHHHHQLHPHHQQQPRSGTVRGGGTTRTTPPSMSSPEDGGKDDVDDVMMLHDGVDGLEFGGAAVYVQEGGRGLPSMPEGDDEDENGHEHQHHQHQHQHQQHQQQHQQGMEVDMGMNMVINMQHFNGIDGNNNVENLRGRTRVVKRGSTNGNGIEKTNGNGNGGLGLKEEVGDDDDVLGVVGGGGFGIGRTRGM